MRTLGHPIAALLVVLLSACGGASYDGHQYVDDNVSFKVDAPRSAWSRVSVDDSADLAWANDDLAATMHVSGSCDAGLDIPLVSLRQHLLIGFTEREFQREELVPMNGREALDSELTAKLDGVPRNLRLVVLKKNDCVYDFAVVAPASSYARANADFDAFLSSFEAP